MSKITNNNQRPTNAADHFLNNQPQQPQNLTNATRKKKWEDRFDRKTFYIEKETFAELERQAGGEKGEKTRIINQALQKFMGFKPSQQEKKRDDWY